MIALDNLAVGREKISPSATGDWPCTFAHVDFATRRYVLTLMASDTVYHLAALADIVPSIEKPAEYFTTNVDGTFNVVAAARASGVKRLIYAASSSCYGIPDVYPTPEDAPIKPQYPYALTKYLGECIALHWGTVYDIPTVSLRFFNVFGPSAEHRAPTAQSLASSSRRSSRVNLSPLLATASRRATSPSLWTSSTGLSRQRGAACVTKSSIWAPAARTASTTCAACLAARFNISPNVPENPIARLPIPAK